MRLGVRVLGSALVLGAASTLGDWIWAEYLTDGAVVPGVIHGLLFFVVLACVLGWATDMLGASGRLLVVLPLVGLALAAAFYPLAAALGYLAALLVCWVLMWLCLASAVRWAGRLWWSRLEGIGRGLAAALGSGVAFWLVSGLWTGAAPESWLVRVTWWTFAFLPGVAALVVGRGGGPGRGARSGSESR